MVGLAPRLGEVLRPERKREAEMMPKWSRLHEACRNCGTLRRTHHGKGFCKPCHVMMKRIWAAEKWDLRRPKSLTSLPPLPMWTRDAIVAGLADRNWSDAEFERY